MFKIDVVTEELGNARMRAAHERPYFAAALFRLVPVLTDRIDTLAVDQWWRVYYNNEYLKRNSVIENATALIHEVEHLLRDHAGRCTMHGCDHQLFNIAGDLEINDDLAADSALRLARGTLQPRRWRQDVADELGVECTALDPALFKLEPGLTAEEYYTLVRRQVEELGRLGKLPQCGSGAHGKRQGHEIGEPDGENRGVRPEEGNLVRKKVAEDVADYAARHPGTVPGGLERWAQEILNPKIPWTKVLAGMIRANVAHVSGMADYSYQRPGRRQSMSEDVIIPSFVEPVPKVGIVIDTSGSMQESQLSQALAEVKGILAAVGVEEGVSVISCDAAAQPAQKIFAARKVKLFGGGGTNMGEGLAAARKLRPTPDFIVCITDGYTPWPEAPPAGTRVIVVLVGDGVAPGWAKVVYADVA